MPGSLACLTPVARFITLVLLILLLPIATAWSHASLSATDPQDGAVVQMAPERFSLTFSEPVSPLSLRLVRPDGSSLALDRFSVKDRVVAIKVPDGLGRGTHVLSWRVVSEDGHPVSGALLFSIGETSATAPGVADEDNRAVRSLLWLSKVALYVGLFIGVGGVFARRILAPGADAGEAVIHAALIIGALGAIVSLGLQGLDALGAQIGRFAETTVWSAGLATSYGRTVIVALMALSLAGGALVLSGLAAQMAAAVALFLVGLALALSGHASAASPQWLMRPAVFLHATAIAIWIGALVPLGLALREDQPGAGRALSRFSRVIPAIVAILIVAGLILAIVQVERPAALLETAYGQVFLLKLVLLVCLFLLAALHRWVLTAPAEVGEAQARRELARSIAIETLVVLLIFSVAAAWRFTPPPRALAVEAPAMTRIQAAQVVADLTVTPGRAGPGSVSAVVTKDGSVPLIAKQVTFVFSNPEAGIEPFKHKAEKAGDGSWRADDILLPLPGKWSVRIDVLVDDFEIVRLRGRIEIKK